MQIIDDYLRRDLGRDDLESWDQIRMAYLERADSLIKNDWQSPAYLSSIDNEAGRRNGKIVGNIDDYTRDQHDLSKTYEKKFSKEYLPRIGILPFEPYITSSGMAALGTIIHTIHRLHGVNETILVGKHSYFQNLELLSSSFARVIIFDEMNHDEWMNLVKVENPLAIFVDTMCNESELTVPPVLQIGKYLRQQTKRKVYLVIDNSMLSIGFPWWDILKYRSRNLVIVGWESLNKYYQFGMDRTTGGVMWGTGKMNIALFRGRINSGTILPDINTAMLPTPNRVVMLKYLARIEENRIILQKMMGITGISADTGYGFSGAQVIVKLGDNYSYDKIQNLIKRIIALAKKKNVQISAGSSFGLRNTRIYLTARKTEFAQMFLRISVGVEDGEQFGHVAQIIYKGIK